MIEAIPKAGLASDAEKNKFMGETMFLRALAYFHLVRNWGAIPLRTVENMSEYNVPRTPESEVYELIISDLELCRVNTSRYGLNYWTSYPMVCKNCF